MTSFRLKINRKDKTASRFFAKVVEQLQNAAANEKRSRGLTQQELATLLDVNRSVVNRRMLGRDNMTVRTLGEMAWALGYEPDFSLKKVGSGAGSNAYQAKPSQVETTSDSQGTNQELKVVGRKSASGTSVRNTLYVSEL